MYNIGSKDLGILPVLVMVIEWNRSHRQLCHGYALSILEKLAKGSENILYMGSEELGLLPALVRLLSYSDYRGDCLRAVNILYSLSDEPVNRALMGSEALGLVTVLREKALIS